MVRSLLFLFLFPAAAQAQTLTYQWLNQPCGSTISCEGGCTACNMAAGSSQTFIGSDVGMLGIDVCPHPVTDGDNALLTYGWPFVADPSHAVIVTGLALQPMYIDSVVIRHRSGVDGPQRLLVKFGANESMPSTVIGDILVPTEWEASHFADLGLVQATPEMVYGFFSLTLQPYQGNGGSWDLDELRISASPAATSAIVELEPRTPPKDMAPVDLLGRRVSQQRALGIYFDGRVRPVVR
jgi:hypothetical protein